MPFSELELAVDYFGPDLTLRLNDTEKAGAIALLNYPYCVAQRLTGVDVCDCDPLRLAAALWRLPLFDCEESVWHI
jgi:hypothetical protein